jgi:RNA polymerase sigma-70 factor, ECF subfamily
VSTSGQFYPPPDVPERGNGYPSADSSATARGAPRRRRRQRSSGIPSEVSDLELMQAHVSGDPDAFTQLVRRHRDRLWAVALRTMSDREEAADALQDALISAFRNAASYRGEAAVTTWLHRVVVNACLDRIRRRQARPSVPLGDTEYASRGDDHARTEARLDVHAALGRLPAPQRAAIVLVDLQDLSVAEAAEILGVAEGTVKSRCSRGRTALARMFRAAATEAEGHSGYGSGNSQPSPHVAPPTTPRADGPTGPATRGWGGG